MAKKEQREERSTNLVEITDGLECMLEPRAGGPIKTQTRVKVVKVMDDGTIEVWPLEDNFPIIQGRGFTVSRERLVSSPRVAESLNESEGK